MTQDFRYSKFDGKIENKDWNKNFKTWNEYFNKYGYIVIENALSQDIVESIRNDLIKLNNSKHSSSPLRHIVHKCFFEHSPSTVKLVENSLITEFAQYVIRGGPETDNKFNERSYQIHLTHNNAFSVPPEGRGQAPGWHMDDPPQQIILPEGKKLPSDVILPVLIVTYMIWLSDCDKPENGPTYVVPESHRFGKKVIDTTYADKYGIPTCGKAGTAVLVNSQLWHRGCRNSSVVPRDTLQLTFGRRTISHMFGSIMDFKMKKYVIEGKSDKTKEIWGYLQGGAYS
jgi:ectoine hydroxylase-related dioxygenase (phytanoyl-CoA dioxygenase family)